MIRKYGFILLGLFFLSFKFEEYGFYKMVFMVQHTLSIIVRRIKEPWQILFSKGKEVESVFWKELCYEIGGEDKLKDIIDKFQPAKLIVDDDGVQLLGGISEVNNYKVAFIMFPDTRVIFNIFNIFKPHLKESYRFPEGVFLPLPQKYFPKIREKLLTIQAESVPYKINSVLLGSFFTNDYKLKEILSYNPILENLMNTFIQRDKIPALSAEVYLFYTYLASAVSTYLRALEQILILRRLEILPTVYLLAHELTHHFCYENQLDRLGSTFKFAERFSQNYPQLYQAISKVCEEEKIGEEGLAILFGAFADISQENKKHVLIGEEEKSYYFFIKTIDVEFFADIGLIPDWMRPSRLGFKKEYIDASYYDLIRR